LALDAILERRSATRDSEQPGLINREEESCLLVEAKSPR
jgi:hypothetical protein